jgi:hypothetical protein
MSHPHKRKRLVLKLTPEQASDPQSILDATRDALREQLGKTLEVRKVPSEEPPPVEPPPVEPQPERTSLPALQTAAEDLAAAVLRQKAEEIKAKGEPARFDWKKWAGRLKGFGEFVTSNKDWVLQIAEAAGKKLGM